MACRSCLLLLTLVSVANMVWCSENVDAEDIYELLFEQNEKSPVSAAKAHELLIQAKAYYSGKTLTESDGPKVDLISSYLEAGIVRADKCNSNEFKKLNLMYITGLYSLNDGEHFGLNDLPSLFYDDLHYTNALDYLKTYRRKQVKECAKHLEESGVKAVENINAKVRKDLTDTSRDFVDSLYRIAKTLILGTLKNKRGQEEYGQLFRREVGVACSTISTEIEPLLTLQDLLKSEGKKGEIQVSEYFANWIDRAKTCESILERMDEIVGETYKVYAGDKTASGKSFLGKMMGKCFGKKSCRKTN